MLSWGRGVGIRPAHDVHAHALGGLVELDRVAPALVHRAAVLAEQGGVAEDRAERLLPAQDGAHREHRVEPVAELAGEALRDEVGREPLRPVVRVLAVVERARTGRSRRRATGCRRRGSATTGAPQPGQAICTASTYGRCGVWPSSASQPSTARSAELLAAADHVERAAGGAVVDRQRQAPVALLADHPVVHVQEPVELALVAERRDPADPVDDLHDLVAQAGVHLGRGQLLARPVVDRAHADVPLVDQPEDQRRAAAPAVRVAVGVRLQAVEEAVVPQVLHDRVGRRRGRRARRGSRSRR